MVESWRRDGESGADEAASDARGAVDFAELRRQLLRTITHVCPPWLADQREDIVQMALIRVMKVLEEGESNPTHRASYLWKVAHSATVDQIRRLRRRREVPLEAEDAPRMPEAGARANPFAQRAHDELDLAIRACLATISESRRLVVGFHLMGHTVSEMAELLDTGTKRIRNLLFRGLSNLRSCLADKGFAP